MYFDNFVKLKDLKLHKEHHADNNAKGGSNSYYLSAVYEYENNFVVSEITIPHIALPLNVITGFDTDLTSFSFSDDIEYTLHMPGDHTLPVYRTDKGVYYEEKIIKEKRQKMTLEEVEDALGYKIELVSER